MTTLPLAWCPSICVIDGCGSSCKARHSRPKNFARSRVCAWLSANSLTATCRLRLRPGARRRGELSGRGRLGSRDTGSRVGVVLVQSLTLEQCTRKRVEPRPILRQEGDDLVVCLGDDAPHLVVDELPRLRCHLGCAGEERPR